MAGQSDADIASLNDEFNRAGSVMRVETYKARLAEIRARAPTIEPAPTPRYIKSFAAPCTPGAFDPKYERIIEGVATTPSTNTRGYALNPLGCELTVPVPLLLSHHANQRIGEVTFAERGPTGVAFRAQLFTDGEHKKLANDVWARIVLGELRCVSVAPVSCAEDRPRKDCATVYHRWDWGELSVCPIGACPGAKITRATSVTRGDDWAHEALHFDVRPEARVVYL